MKRGLVRAYNNFSSEENNKIVILLTDGMPNYDLEWTTTCVNDFVSETGSTIRENTKARIETLQESGVYVISMLTDYSVDEDESDDYTEEEYEECVEELFGTTENPTADAFYYVSDDDIENTITTDIFSEISSFIQNSITDITITDYFPEEILEYFDLTIDTPSTGEVSELDTDTGTIIWTIDTLSGNAIATLQYTLTIKDMSNEELLGTTIATNEKVVLTYIDYNSDEYEVTLTTSPSICLMSYESSNSSSSNSTTNSSSNTNSDSSTSTSSLPYTGSRTKLIGIIIVFVTIAVVTCRKRNNLKEIKK